MRTVAVGMMTLFVFAPSVSAHPAPRCNGLDIEMGMKVLTKRTVNLRSEPSVRNSGDPNVVANISPGTELLVRRVAEGPTGRECNRWGEVQTDVRLLFWRVERRGWILLDGHNLRRSY